MALEPFPLARSGVDSLNPYWYNYCASVRGARHARPEGDGFQDLVPISVFALKEAARDGKGFEFEALNCEGDLLEFEPCEGESPTHLRMKNYRTLLKASNNLAGMRSMRGLTIAMHRLFPLRYIVREEGQR